MIVKMVRLVVPLEEEDSTLMLGDLRKFMAETESADGDVDVIVERKLYDGRPSDVIEAKWAQR